MRTLRARIALWYGGIIALCLIGYAVAVAASFAHHVRRELDHRVHEDIELAALALSVDATGSAAWPGGFLSKQIEEEDGGGHRVEIWSPAGIRLLTAGTFDPKLPGDTAPREHAPRTFELPAGAVRVETAAVEVESRTFLVRAIVAEESARSQVRGLWLDLALISATVLFLGGIGGVVLARRLLGPLARMAQHARRITAEDLHERMNVEVTGEELEHLRDAFNATLSQLERSFGQLRRFTADASHEIRTPLTALRSVGEVALQGEKSKDDYREVIGTMLEEVDRLSRLADELLTIARAESGQAHYSFEPLDLGQLATSVASQLEVLAEEREQSVVLHVAAGVMVTGDRLSLRQALINLIDNAIKYSPEGSTVTVSVRSEDNAIVEVSDQGPGIAADQFEKIFERFYRVDASRSREMGGTGLGLSLVKIAADANRATIEIDSEVGKGSTFRLIMPRAVI